MDFQSFSQDFIGLRRPAPIIGPDGIVRTVPRVYLDSAATCLMPRAVMQAVHNYLEYACANSHTTASAQGRETTAALARAHDLVGRLIGYDPKNDSVILIGNGTTAASNLLAAALFHKSPRPLAIVSEMEHHSNRLPWIRAAGKDEAGESNVRFAPCRDDGTLDLSKLKEMLDKEGSKVRVVAVTGVSNVTGVINPIYEIAKLAHAHGAEIAVDAAQAGAHVPISMHSSPETQLDHVVMSGHKLYAPGSPGVLVTKSTTFADCGWDIGAVGGGTVDYVGSDGVLFKDNVVERQEAGTPNIPGTIALGTAAGLLASVGLNTIRQHEIALTHQLIQSLVRIPGVGVYGPHDANLRAGVVAFNVGTMHHSLVAAALDNMGGIAVRNDCFCAQPYVREQLDAACETQGFCLPPTVRGMVRASIGVYTTLEDIQRLAVMIAWIATNEKLLEQLYALGEDGEYHHRYYRSPPQFDLDQQIAHAIAVRPAGQAAPPPVRMVSPGWAALVGLSVGALIFWVFSRQHAPLAHRERQESGWTPPERSRILRS